MASLMAHLGVRHPPSDVDLEVVSEQPVFVWISIKVQKLSFGYFKSLLSHVRHKLQGLFVANVGNQSGLHHQ